MINCTNCNQNCFERVNDDCIPVSVTSQVLEIKKGTDSLQTALQKIISYVESIDLTQSVTSESELGDLNTLTSTSNSFISNSRIKIDVFPGNTSTTITYDLLDLISEFNCGSTLSKVTIYGTNPNNGSFAKLDDSSSKSRAFTVSPQNFPITIDAEVYCIKNGGNQTKISYRKKLDNVKSSYSDYVSYSNLSPTSLGSQKEVNEHFDELLGSISNKLAMLEEKINKILA